MVVVVRGSAVSWTIAQHKYATLSRTADAKPHRTAYTPRCTLPHPYEYTVWAPSGKVFAAARVLDFHWFAF